MKINHLLTYVINNANIKVRLNHKALVVYTLQSPLNTIQF